MMRTVKIDEMTGFRRPSEEERAGVSRHMRYYYNTTTKQTRIIGIILAVLGALLIIGGIAGRNVIGAVLGAAAIAGAVMAFRTLSAYRKETDRFERGDFRVLDGKVSKRELCPDIPGVSSVEFTSLTGQVADGMFEVRQEGLEIGTPLLLVYVSGEERKEGGKFTWAFTPFMLTEEGARKHR